MTNRPQPCFEGLKNLLLTQVGKLVPKALDVAKSVVVDETDEAKKLQKRVWSGVAVRRIFGLFASASLSVLATMFEGL